MAEDHGAFLILSVQGLSALDIVVLDAIKGRRKEESTDIEHGYMNFFSHLSVYLHCAKKVRSKTF